MDNEKETCGVCFTSYDSADHLPRVLINCGHTLCSSCLTEIIKTPHFRKCPFDNRNFDEWQNRLENFPVNFALLALLERRSQNSCQVHNKELGIFCLQDKEKICYDCALFGKHNGHLMKKIKDLKAKGMKLKKDLEENFLKFEKNQLEKDHKINLLKAEFLSRMGNRCEDIKNMLKIKEVEWTKKIDNLFERNIKNDKRLLWKKEAEKTLEEINQAYEKEDNNLAILDQDFKSIISRLQTQARKEEMFKFSEETSRAMDCIESFLINQEKSIRSFDFLKKVEIEQEEFSSIGIIERRRKSSIIKAETRLTLEIRGESLFIGVKKSIPMSSMADLGELNKIKRVKVELEQYDSLSPDSTDLNFLSEILHQLSNCTSLVVKFTPLSLRDLSVFILFDHLFCRIQQLTDIKITFGYKYFGEYQMIELFCNSILPKATSLRNLTLKLGSSLITNDTLFALAKSFRNLESFTLGVGNTAISDSGLVRIFCFILGVKALDLDLKETWVTDQSLKMLGNYMKSSMKNLEKLSLDLSETKITIEGVSAIFTGIPKDIKCLNLDFSRVMLPDEVVFLFKEKVCPKLELVEEVHLRLEGRHLELKVEKILESIGKGAAQGMRVCSWK